MKKERKVILAIAALSIVVMMVTATVPVLGKSKLSNQDTFDFSTGAKKQISMASMSWKSQEEWVLPP